MKTSNTVIKLVYKRLTLDHLEEKLIKTKIKAGKRRWSKQVKYNWFDMYTIYLYLDVFKFLWVSDYAWRAYCFGR